MLDQHQLLIAIRRGARVLFYVCALSVLALATPKAAPVATGVSATTSGASTFITISGTAPMAYSVSRPDADTILVELPGVDAKPLAQAYAVATPLVNKVTVEREHRHNFKPLSRFRVSLRAPVRDRSHLAGNNFVLVLSPDAAREAGPSAKGAPVETASAGAPPPGAGGEAALKETSARSSATPQTQTPLSSRAATGPTVTITSTAGDNGPLTEQGQQYGQPGFVGEPINLNVVNADVRDILNYITEQYGVNFVIDKSVGAVPVTINVTDVPWNLALDAILEANRLGIDINGNILRVATMEVIAQEAATQQQIKEARLNNSPLVTEFIRLNYARAGGSLSSVAGNAGAFAGGIASGATAGASLSLGSSGVSGSSSGIDQGILPIVQRRLSKRGSVEVDGRSNTLIITDVKENIETVRQLVTLLDQPEPQVEIETRIVIAQRNFSRDLGMQLSAVGVNYGRGGIGALSTLPATSGAGSGSGGTLPSGINPFGVPGGLSGTNQPGNSLAAAAANTVIGLTTGIIGTSQISALLSAAETKGQAKIVATPRVTALNNRTAQIESGQQIPVQTALGTTGATVVSTTFVSVPLRLSVTPQITDVGTVVLRVTAENNSLNSTIAVGGVPGIDTQRMQSEVLVPDGGTTVMGGVLADNEGETQQRTPGIAGIPVLGNLFKRRLTTRTTNELLFFITPRIYRPDYEGRPTAGTVGTGTRSVSLPQPVPLGNPPTNTPSTNTQSTEQQQNVTPVMVQPVPATPQTRP